MERTLRLKNLLARSASDFLWFESLFKEKVEYLDAFRDLLYTRQWVRDVAANSNTMKMISKSQMLMREVAASAVAMREVAASAVAMREVAANDGAMAILLGTPEFLQITVSSATARSAVWSNQAAWVKVSESDMAVGKYVAGCAGLDPGKFEAMQAVAASATAMQAVAKSAQALNIVLKSNIARTAMSNQNAQGGVQSMDLNVLRNSLNDSSKFSKTIASSKQDGAINAGAPAFTWNNSSTPGECIVIVEKAGGWGSGIAMWRHLQNTGYELARSTSTQVDSQPISKNAICIGGIQYTESGDAGIIVSAWKAI